MGPDEQEPCEIVDNVYGAPAPGFTPPTEEEIREDARRPQEQEEGEDGG